MAAALSEPSTGVTEFTLVRGSEVLGVVIDESGTPVAGAEVELRLGAVSALPQVESDYLVRAIPGGNGGFAYLRTIRTDAEGKFAFRGVCPGHHAATASKEGYIGAVLSDDRRYRALHKDVTVAAGRRETIKLELRKLYGAVVRVSPNPVLPIEIWRSCVGIEYSEPRAMAMLSYAHVMIGRKLEKQLRSKYQREGSLVSAHVVLARPGIEIGGGNDRSPLAVDYFGDIRFRNSLRFVALAELTEADVCNVTLQHDIDEVVDLKVLSAYPVQAHRIVKGNVTGYLFLAKTNQKGEFQFRVPKGGYELRAPPYTFLDEEKYRHRVQADGAKNRVVDIRDERNEIYTWRVAVHTEAGEPASDFLLGVTSIRETGNRRFTRRAADKLSEFSFIAPRGSYRVALRRLNGQLVEQLTVELVRDTKNTLRFPK